MVIGLEVHVELKTRDQDILRLSHRLWRRPQHPVLPGLHRSAGHACRYSISRWWTTPSKRVWPLNCDDRPLFQAGSAKTTFTPTCPRPIRSPSTTCRCASHGYLDIQTKAGAKRIGITRIHIEEDAGKLIHDPVQRYACSTATAAASH